MKKNTFWTVLLLLSFSFSMVHAFVIEANEVDHCTAQEYVQEFSQSNNCGDLCDLRHMFYQSFTIVNTTILFDYNDHSDTPVYIEKNYLFQLNPLSFRPPIAA